MPLVTRRQSLAAAGGALPSFLASHLVAAAGREKLARSEPRKRCRELGIEIGVLAPGPRNMITDIGEVRVGHRTLQEGTQVRTGVSLILPHAGNLFQEKVPAAVVVGNGFGKLVGSTQVQELGVLETPIGLTNTLSTFTVADALIKLTLAQEENERVRSVNPVVGECNDGYLNDIRGQHVKTAHVREAYEQAAEIVAEGSVGAGTGTRCLGWKGGIGTSSRELPQELGSYRVGVLAQTNFGGSLTVAGVPVGRMLGRGYLQEATQQDRPQNTGGQPTQPEDQGSCILVVATDAALNARQLSRLGRRALFGLAAVGSPMTHGSGDYVIAFSTHPAQRQAALRQAAGQVATQQVERLPDQRLSPLFQAVRDAATEAILNSLFQATTVRGREQHVSEAIPLAQVLDCCQTRGLPLTPLPED